MLLYIHRDPKDYQGRGAQDGHPDFHTALELWTSEAESVVKPRQLFITHGGNFKVSQLLNILRPMQYTNRKQVRSRSMIGMTEARQGGPIFVHHLLRSPTRMLLGQGSLTQVKCAVTAVRDRSTRTCPFPNGTLGSPQQSPPSSNDHLAFAANHLLACTPVGQLLTRCLCLPWAHRQSKVNMVLNVHRNHKAYQGRDGQRKYHGPIYIYIYIQPV